MCAVYDVINLLYALPINEKLMYTSILTFTSWLLFAYILPINEINKFGVSDIA